MSESSVQRAPVAEAKRVVIKVGTRVLTQTDGRLALTRLFSLVETIAQLKENGREVLLVSSGAVGLGRDALRFERNPTDVAERQACAAVGQSRLMELYSHGFDRLGLVAAQVLLTEDDFDNRERYLNLGNTLNALLKHGAVPIINENDAISTVELAVATRGGRQVFGDNDRLSALVASELGCELLVLLTDVDGVFERDPRTDPSAKLISCVDDVEGGMAELSGSGSDA
ncbi:MAG: glutamate 5-kinase, partial [Myxococcota bacterium]